MKGNFRILVNSLSVLLAFFSINYIVAQTGEKDKINLAKSAIKLASEHPDSCKAIAESILVHQNTADDELKAYAYEALGEAFYYLQELDSAALAYKKALGNYVTVKNKERQAAIYNNLGLIDYYQGKYGKALDNYYASLEIEKELKNEMGVARSHHNIGMVYGRWERYDQQFEHYNIALAIYEKYNNQESIAGLTNNMGVTYAALKQYSKALEYYRKAYFAYKKLGNKQRMASISTNLGCLFVYLGENLRAIDYFNEAIDYFSNAGDKMGLVATYSSTGDAYRAVGNTKEAVRYYLLVEEVNQDLDLLAHQKDNYLSLYEVYKELGDYKKALGMYESYIRVNDSIFTTEKYERLIELEKKYHLEKSQKELIELKAKDQKHELMIWGLSIFFIFSSVLVLIGVYILKMKERQRRQIMEQKVLRTQMNPHFIFNALSALQCFIIEENQDEALEFVADFSSLMRLVLQYAKEESITLKKEKEILERYVSLQNRRFEKKIKFELEFDEHLKIEKVMVPPMLIQPFVENAIEHGCLNEKGNGFIKVMYFRDRDKLAITVEDNGIGIKKSQQKMQLLNHKSMAMELTRERIRLLHKNRGKKYVPIEIEDLSDYELSGTRITFWIPYMEIG